MAIAKILPIKLGSMNYDVFVDGFKISTLRSGTSSELYLSSGKHRVYFKEALFGGAKSNKLDIEVKSSKDNILIELNPPSLLNESKPMASFMIGQMDSAEVICTSCDALNIVIQGDDKVCEYCGSPLSMRDAITHERFGAEKIRAFNQPPYNENTQSQYIGSSQPQYSDSVTPSTPLSSFTAIFSALRGQKGQKKKKRGRQFLFGIIGLLVIMSTISSCCSALFG